MEPGTWMLVYETAVCCADQYSARADKVEAYLSYSRQHTEKDGRNHLCLDAVQV